MSSIGLKRKGDESSACGKKKPAEEQGIAEKADQEPSEDLLSGLPDLCLKAIFSNCSRGELYVARQVNKRMNEIIKEKCFDSIKWEKCFLTLYKTQKGHGFKLCLQDGGHPAISKRDDFNEKDNEEDTDSEEDSEDDEDEEFDDPFTFGDEIVAAPRGYMDWIWDSMPIRAPTAPIRDTSPSGGVDDLVNKKDEEVEEFKDGKEGYCVEDDEKEDKVEDDADLSDWDCDEFDTYQYEIETDEHRKTVERRYFTDWSSPYGGHDHTLQVPDQYFAVLGRLLVRHNVAILRFDDFILDGNFIYKLHRVMEGQRVRKCMLMGINCGPSTKEDAEKFAQFLKESNVRALCFTQSERVIGNGLITEEFILKVGNKLVKLEATLDGDFFFSETEFYRGRFVASRSILPMLCRFRTLSLPCMVLKEEYIFSMFKKYLDAVADSREKARWRVAVDTEITEIILKANFDPEQYSVISDRSGAQFCIKSIITGRIVKFKAQEELKNTDNNQIFLPYDIDFFDNSEGAERYHTYAPDGYRRRQRDMDRRSRGFF